MACTSQSASDYIKRARPHLVRELQNLSVIVENLYQQRVLSDEEVSEIQAEADDYDKTRRILDSVIKKGEEACYKFLRIIDITRKRTLGRQSVLPESKPVPSTETERFDLHHWISCFSFKDETKMETNYLQGSKQSHRYQDYLKSKALKISRDFWMTSKNLFEENKPDLSYTSLVLDTQKNISPSKIKKLKSKKSRMSHPTKLRTYVPEDKPEISPSELLKTAKNILLVGEPGIGKTALSLEMFKVWAERDNEELDYMFYFDMRQMSETPKNLEDLLFNVFSEPGEGKEEVLQDIKKNSDNVTIIFDGVTDLSSFVVQKLVDKDLLPDAKIIITCRPEDEEDVFTEDFLRVEVKGFSEKTIETYLSATLGEEQKKVSSNLELLTLCHVPMYALMVAACFSSQQSAQPCTVTEIYINIVRLSLQMNSNRTKTKDLNSFITNKSEEILSLAQVAFLATEGRTVNLTELPCEDICVLSFLKGLVIEVAQTGTITRYAFLHYTIQEFFAAVWLLKNPDKIKDIFQQCLTEDKKHMKHLIPFMCRLLNEKSPTLMKCLIPAQELKTTSNWFFKEAINTFFFCLCEEEDTEDSGPDVDILFLCQCLYESQCPETCIYFLEKLDYHLDLSGQTLDPYPCCAVSYVIAQSKEKKIRLNLEDVKVSDKGISRLFGCLQNVQWCDPLPLQLWKIFLLSEEQMDHMSLLRLDGNQLHLPVEDSRQLFVRAVKVMKKITTKVNICLYWDREAPDYQDLCESLLEALPHINSLRFRMTYRDPGLQDQEQHHGAVETEKKRLFMDLCLQAAHQRVESFHSVVDKLISLFSFNSSLHTILLDLYEHVKSEGCSSVLPSLLSVFQSAPTVWLINLSERKTSILLEVLKLQPEKKPVQLTGWSDEESEVRSFLQCLPYISQLSFMPQPSNPSEDTRFFVNLFCAAAEREQQTGEKILELLPSVCTSSLKSKWCDFLIDLYSETKTGLRLLPSLLSVFQSAPRVWFINLSERKTSILLEVLKLQPEKKPVKLTGWSDEESEVRSFLQCLPYISRLSVRPWFRVSDQRRFFVNLFCAAAEREQQTREKILELLSSVCRYETFPVDERYMQIYNYQKHQCDFLLDLFSHVKDYETKRGLRVLPSLLSVFQSAPTVWFINLSERKTSILLEVLKLQPQKKPVKLTGWSDEESEVRSFLQCLPYISWLSFDPHSSDPSEKNRNFVNLLCAAAEREQQTREKILELLSSVCRYEIFFLTEEYIYDDNDRKHQCDFLLDLFSHVKDYETKTGLRVLPSLLSVFQSVPTVWFINLSERKTSILLEVMKLQPEKKPVKLTGWSDEESEVRSFLQCLPYISQLSFDPQSSDPSEKNRILVNLFCAAAEREQQTREKILELLSSVCTYQTFPFDESYMKDRALKYHSDFLLNLFSHLKNYETKTGLRVLPSLLSVFQSAPRVWFINLSERKTSILLEVLKLQPQKKPVKLTGWSDEQSEVRSFLQCLPYISRLSFDLQSSDPSEETRIFVNLFCAAAEREQQTGEKILELLSSVCTYEIFPLDERYMSDDDVVTKHQCDFLLDLFSHVKDYETKTGLRVLPSLLSVFQSVPTVWFINLSKRKTSILLEVLKLQPEKKPVKLTGWSDEESEVRSFLQCLPYISRLR
ncbi:Nucleotide-binding oligomerization domain-containing protein 2 [Channa argus]|uniref:Nucleotide-binding oligomerization domain-containing protein 2 n=1 Tax=Channa argus TaxID=215402 RepID=A0A6G1PDF7_CHAAH|nr:Nucleotide-binding oligomerization domain-containing protein 2 [Channa argus]